MSDYNPDDSLQQMFAHANLQLAGDTFTTEVMSQVDKLKRRVIIRRVLLGLTIALITIPLEDFQRQASGHPGKKSKQLPTTVVPSPETPTT